MISGCETEIVFRVEGMLAERRHGGVTKVSRRVSGKSSYYYFLIDPARVCLAERSSGARVYVLQRVGFFLYFFSPRFSPKVHRRSV